MVDINDIDDLVFTNKELEDFLKKFDYNFLDKFNSILYFAQFDYDNKELINNLKIIKEKVLEKRKWNIALKDVEKVVITLNTKEVNLLYLLADSAEMCSATDGRFEEHRSYFDHLRMVSLFELEKRYDNTPKYLLKN